MNTKNKEYRNAKGGNGGDVHAEKPDVYKSERRNNRRYEERLHARFENETCSVLNVSAKGVLLQTLMPDYFFPLDELVDFDLQLEDGEWVKMSATVMWVQCDQLNSKIGLNIQYAPEPYFLFIKELYE
jgi:hypothetical protein